jgi:hypothetical protein
VLSMSDSGECKPTFTDSVRHEFRYTTEGIRQFMVHYKYTRAVSTLQSLELALIHGYTKDGATCFDDLYVHHACVWVCMCVCCARACGLAFRLPSIRCQPHGLSSIHCCILRLYAYVARVPGACCGQIGLLLTSPNANTATIDNSNPNSYPIVCAAGKWVRC